jgi:hypothetical protein
MMWRAVFGWLAMFAPQRSGRRSGRAILAVVLLMVPLAWLLKLVAWCLKTWRDERLRPTLEFLIEEVPFAMWATLPWTWTVRITLGADQSTSMTLPPKWPRSGTPWYGQQEFGVFS